MFLEQLRKRAKQRIKSSTSRVARFVAREMMDEIASSKTPPVVRIDAVDALAQIASGKSRKHLNHFFTWNHRWVALLAERNRRSAVDTYDFIEKAMPDVLFTIDQFAVIRSRSDEIDALNGQVLDFGVYTGGSTRALARIFPDQTVNGFDSFEGLPENWSHMLKGGFGELGGSLPNMPANVQLHKGWFDDTVPVWYEAHRSQPISLLRIDCDIYSSTKTILTGLGSLLRPGSWIVFDELIGYRGWREHEYRAFMEFIDDTGYEYEYIAYGLTYVIVQLGERASLRSSEAPEARSS